MNETPCPMSGLSFIISTGCYLLKARTAGSRNRNHSSAAAPVAQSPCPKIAWRRLPDNSMSGLSGGTSSGSATFSGVPLSRLKPPPPVKNPPVERQEESQVNLSLLDRPRWGWTAAGGVSDVLPPHEVRIVLSVRSNATRVARVAAR